MDNSEIIFYNQINDAVKEGFTGPSITKVCRKRLNQHKGYRWYYLSDYKQSK